jgi:hypothetical protein
MVKKNQEMHENKQKKDPNSREKSNEMKTNRRRGEDDEC